MPSTKLPSSTGSPGQLPGTATNDNAAAGNVGEFISSNIALGSAVPLTTGISANVTSVSLTPGDWDVFGTVFTNPAGTTTQSQIIAGLNTVSATLPGAPNEAFSFSVVPAGSPSMQSTPLQRITLTATTTIFLVTQIGFAVSTDAAYGLLRARRAR